MTEDPKQKAIPVIERRVFRLVACDASTKPVIEPGCKGGNGGNSGSMGGRVNGVAGGVETGAGRQ
jgi:hypothetical protein